MIDAQTLARSLVGQPLATVTGGRLNTILAIDGTDALVATARSPRGKPVPIAWLQEALDRLEAGELVEIAVESVGYRSAFVGAVLRTLPFVCVEETTPPVVKRDHTANTSPSVLAEFERRLRMYADLVEAGGPEAVPAQVVRATGIYGGAGGVWADVGRTRGVGNEASVAVGLRLTGRHYPDDLSEGALLYHYPRTERPAGRDAAEIESLKAAGRLRLPVFAVTEEGARRSVRRGWVATWDDEEELVLVEFGPLRAEVARGDEIDAEAFDPHETVEQSMRAVLTRPNQQRFRIQVLQRYGKRCALCDVATLELITAAHLIPFREEGTSDPRNGLPLCANHHAAMDRGLLTLDQGGRVHLAPDHKAESLGVTQRDLTHLAAQPASEALKRLWTARSREGWTRP